MSLRSSGGCGWAGPVPKHGESALCGACHKLRTPGQVARCQFRGGPRIEGLGDVIAKVTRATGIAQAVEYVTGGDCGCLKRQEALNKAVPFGITDSENAEHKLPDESISGKTTTATDDQEASQQTGESQ